MGLLEIDEDDSDNPRNHLQTFYTDEKMKSGHKMEFGRAIAESGQYFFCVFKVKDSGLTIQTLNYKSM